MIASVFSNAETEWLVAGLGVLAFLAMLANHVLGVVGKARALYGRKPPFDEDFRTHQKVLDELKLSLAGLAPKEKMDELVKQLGSFATQPQIQRVELEMTEMIKREEFERVMKELENDIQAQIKEQRDYLHRAVDQLHAEIRDQNAATELYRGGMQNRMNVFTEVLFEIRGRCFAVRNEDARQPK